MNATPTAREALIAEALGDVARMLDRVDALVVTLEAGVQALERAGLVFTDQLEQLDATVERATQGAKTRAVEHIVQRTGEATSLAIRIQNRAMEDAAKTAFGSQIDALQTRLVAAVHRLIQSSDSPCRHWLAHLATAAFTGVFTWFTLGFPGFK